jgi:Bifunctional DNA primase/polymerase, N-terminal
VKADGGYVAAPFSTHPNGKIYRWFDASIVPTQAPDWLVQLARKKPQSISERALATIKPRNGELSAYGGAALDDEIASLSAALPGTRNSALNRVAFRLFQLVAGGELDQALVEDRLVEACHANGLIKDDGLRSVLATIASARAGLQHPRSRRGAP